MYVSRLLIGVALLAPVVAFASPAAAQGQVIVGTEGRDTLEGGPGDDEIFGRVGPMCCEGLAGTTRYPAKTAMIGSKEAPATTFSRADCLGGRGNDIIDGGSGRDFMMGDDGDDRLAGNADGDRMGGGRGNDLLFGGEGDDNAFGGDGVDIVNGGSGDDTLDGDPGDDRLSGGPGNDDFFAGLGDDVMAGGPGDDEFFGDDGDDILSGGPGVDLLEGDAGADRIRGGGDDDELVFFLGRFNPSSPFQTHDRVSDFEGAGAVGGDELRLETDRLVFRGEVSIDPQLGAPLPGPNNGVKEVVYTFVDDTTWLLADENDNGVLDNRDFALELRGEQALTEADFTELTDFVTAGTEGDDRISGTQGPDVIFGLGGDDVLRGRAGDDELDGGAGNDRLLAGAGFDTLRGGIGKDTLIMGEGGTASGGAGDDVLFGGTTFFTLFEGGKGEDTLQTDVADDALSGNEGVDRFRFNETWGSDSRGGSDVIGDFEDGLELIEVLDPKIDFDDLTISEEFGDAVVTNPEGDRIVLSGQAGNIDEADFLFH